MLFSWARELPALDNMTVLSRILNVGIEEIILFERR